MRPLARFAAVLGLSLVATATVAAPAQAAVSYKNCSELHKSYPHGVGRTNARDKTSGKPVTTFKKDTAAYNRAVKARASLDGDKDGIACEKR